MIIGRGARGVLNYISTAHKTDRPNTRPNFTNMAGSTARELSKEVAALRKSKPKLGKAAAHLILSHDPSDRPLTEREWSRALQLALQAHGATDAPFAAYLHTDRDHQHLHCFFYASGPTAASCRTAKTTKKMKLRRAGLKRSCTSNRRLPNHQLTLAEHQKRPQFCSAAQTEKEFA